MHDGKKECRLIVVGDGKKGSRSVNNSAKRRLKGDLIEPDCILQICAVVVRRYGRRELCTCSPPARRPPSSESAARICAICQIGCPSFPLRSLTDFGDFVPKLVNLSAPPDAADANCDGGIE